MTNQLFRDVLDGRIPMPRKQARPVFYFLPNLADPTAPTVAELNAGIDLSEVVTTGYTIDAVAADEPKTVAESLQEIAAATGMSTADIMDVLTRAGAAPDKEWTPTYVMPPPKPWAGNIATQKRPRRAG